MTDLTWVAHYDDGSTLSQKDSHTYADINRIALQAFDLMNGSDLVVRVDLRDDAKEDLEPRRLIWRIRHTQSTNGDHQKYHLIGWQRKVNGQNVQAICYVFEDGKILLGGQFREDDFTHAVTPFGCEGDLST